MLSTVAKKLLDERAYAKECMRKSEEDGDLEAATFYAELALSLGWEALKEMNEKT